VRFAVECYQRMGALGMPTVEAALTHAIFTLEWWESFARRTDTSEGGKWASAMQRKMRRRRWTQHARTGGRRV
jgi:hypothetical protein